MTTTKTMRTIVEGLNAEPFNRQLSMVKFDSWGGEKLLQTLSDVLGWIQGLPPSQHVDIRSETPDETALRIMNALRILKYPPPRDIDHIQKWRLDILEGNKTAIYPVLEWMFDNVDRLKERVYLASFLTKVEVPVEEQSPDVLRVINLVEQKMQEFKEVHGRIVESRSDFVRAEDIHADLKAMTEEKEQLSRKIERSRRKVARRPDLDKCMTLAARLRHENEKNQDLQIQRQEQRNALVHTGQRLNRLERTLNEIERERETNDPRVLMNKMKREMEVNQYMLNEKLVHDITAQKKNVEVLQKILAMRTVNKEDIAKLKEKIERLNTNIMDMSVQRDKKDEASEDKLVIYRHQSTNIQRKKANIADSLHSTRQELDHIEAMIMAKKTELTEKSGKEEVVSSVQYKIYVKKLRNKSNFYKRKKAELEQAKAEVQILERTIEVLSQKFKEIKQENINEGRGVIETMEEDSDLLNRRPKTAKPTTTDVRNLKSGAEELSNEINQKRSAVQQLNQEIESFYHEHKNENEQFYAKQAEFETSKRKMEEEQEELRQELTDLENRMTRISEELQKNREYAGKQSWFIANMESEHRAETACLNLEKQNSDCLKSINQLNSDLFNVGEKEDVAEQIEMWKGLIQIFEQKIKLHRAKGSAKSTFGDDKAMGDRMYY